MKALLSKNPGGPETLVLDEVPDPVPGSKEVRVAVRACGVNYPDLLIIQDLYQYKPSRPFAPGAEIAGVVDAVGEGVEHLHYGTSQHALKDRAQLLAGETLLVLGAAGGVGLAAVELGKAMGARVIAAASSAEKLALAREHGADEGVQYPAGPLDKAQARALTDRFKAVCGADGAQVIYDGVGGDYTEAALRAIGWQGRHLVVGFPAGIPKLPLNLPLLKSCQIVGVFWGEFTARYPALHAANVAALMTMYLEGRIKPAVTERFPLARGGEAIARLGAREARGKVVVTIGG